MPSIPGLSGEPGVCVCVCVCVCVHVHAHSRSHVHTCPLWAPRAPVNRDSGVFHFLIFQPLHANTELLSFLILTMGYQMILQRTC